MIDTMTDPALFQPWFSGDTWAGWRTILKGAMGLPMIGSEPEFFRSVSDRDPPQAPAKEVVVIGGRRGGKDSIASLVGAHTAATFEDRGYLRGGERALVACLAVDRDQAKIVLGYMRSYFTDIPMLRGMVTRETANGFELSNRVDIAVSTNSFRSVRGRPILAAIFDEVAYWRDESSATPDEETYRAIRPGMASLPGSILVLISSPYKKSGLLYRKYRDHYGEPGDVLVIRAPTTALNPSIDRDIIAKDILDDPAAASAEWLAEFRDDLADFVTKVAVDACVSAGVHERPVDRAQRYVCFVDPSGGVSDSMTCAIAHQEGSTSILDVVREIQPPFVPEAAVAEYAALMKTYRIASCTGDRYGSEWVVQAFRSAGIHYAHSERTKSDIYRDSLPSLNSHAFDILDNARLIAQICNLERRTARGGKDSIDHPKGRHDDLANAALGALRLAASGAASGLLMTREEREEQYLEVHGHRPSPTGADPLEMF